MMLDDVAAAMWRARPRRRTWEELDEHHKTQYLQMARAAITALDEVDSCPRCVFENSIAEVVYAGEFIADHYGDRPDQLNPREQRLLKLAKGWLTDDTIRRCLEESP